MNPQGTAPAWLVEKAALGELTARQKEQLAAYGPLSGRLEALAADDERLRLVLPASLPASLPRALLERPAPLRWVPAGGLLAAACAVALAVVAVRSGTPIEASSAAASADGPWTEGTRIKGPPPTVVLYRKTAAGVEELSDGAQVKPRDAVQLAFNPGDATHAAVAWVDTSGRVSMVYPEKGEKAASVEAGRRVLLDFALRLDATAGVETAWLVTSHESFALSDVASALKGARPPRFPSGLQSRSLSVRK